MHRATELLRRLRGIRATAAVVAFTSWLSAQEAFRIYPALNAAPSNFRPWAGAVGDFDGDGNLDVVASGTDLTTGRSVLVPLLGDGTGRLVERSSRVPGPNYGPREIHVRDLDGDGDADLLVGAFEVGRTLVHLNDGSGNFTALWYGFPPGLRLLGENLGLGDVDGDGSVDLLVPNRDGPKWLLLNDGTGRFTDASSRLTSDNEYTVASFVDDVDHDGDADLLFIDLASPTAFAELEVHFNDGTGHFPTVRAIPTPFHGGSFLALFCDADADGSLDVFSVNLGSGLGLMVGDGQGGFVPANHHLPATTLRPIAAATLDVDDDGRLDLLVSSGSDARLLVADSSGRFSEASSSRLPSVTGLYSFVTGDLDRDGDDDVWFGYYGASPSIVSWFNQHRHVGAVTPPTTGTVWVAQIGHGPLAVPSYALAVPMISPRRIQLEIAPFGVLGVEPPTTVVLGAVQLAAGTPHGEFVLGVPSDPQLVGFEFALQVLIFELLGPARLTNVWTSEVR